MGEKMSYERISPEAIPDALLETVGVMRRASRSMSSIETELSKIMRLSDLDPRLHSELGKHPARSRPGRNKTAIPTLLRGGGPQQSGLPCDAHQYEDAVQSDG